jgi:2-polyprenyl-3-methyl-5-hydroxy-6-metoxy-1,4-benzoquinol methylase
MKKDTIQKLQDDEYDFPYHHIPLYKKNYFNQCFNFAWGINYVATIEFLIDKLKQEKFQSLVDIGCGDGRLTKELREEFKNKEIEGIDYSEKAIALAKAMDFYGTYHCLDILSSQTHKKYDISLLIEVFEHIHPDISEAFLRAVARLLNKGGLLILTVPHINVPVELKHYRHFSVEGLSNCLEKYFDIIEIIPLEKNSKIKEFLDLLLTNDFFILNHVKLKNRIYKLYKSKLFLADNEELCKRIYVKARLK